MPVLAIGFTLRARLLLGGVSQPHESAHLAQLLFPNEQLLKTCMPEKELIFRTTVHLALEN